MLRDPRVIGCAALLLAALVAGAVTLPDHGLTWDEPTKIEQGELTLAFYASGGADRRCDAYLDLWQYGSAFVVPYVLAGRALPEHAVVARHAVILAAGLAGLLATMLIAGQIAGARAALLSGLALALMPRFAGDAFNNAIDVPLAAAWALAVAALLALARARRAAPWVLAAGLSIGLAMGIRVIAVALLGLAGLALLLAPRGGEADPPRSPWLRRAALLAGVALTAWVVMLAAWPWAQLEPIARPLGMLREATRFHATYPVLFEGQVASSDALPRHYVPWYLLITTPLPVIALALGGMAVAVRRLIAGTGRREALAVLLAWPAAPVLAAVALRPNVYDGIRQFLFVVPAIAVLAGLGADALLARIPAARRGLALAAELALVAVLLLPLADIVRLHPYSSAYFNAITGGLRGAAGRYETDYWLASYKEAVEWIGARHAAGGPRVVVLVAADDFGAQCASAHAPAHVEVRRIATARPGGPLPDGVDYLIATTRWGLWQSYPDSPVVHEVGRDGATFTIIRGREGAR